VFLYRVSREGTGGGSLAVGSFLGLGRRVLSVIMSLDVFKVFLKLNKMSFIGPTKKNGTK
jgi:hypothetical protein